MLLSFKSEDYNVCIGRQLTCMGHVLNKDKLSYQTNYYFLSLSWPSEVMHCAATESLLRNLLIWVNQLGENERWLAYNKNVYCFSFFIFMYVYLLMSVRDLGNHSWQSKGKNNQKACGESSNGNDLLCEGMWLLWYFAEHNSHLILVIVAS